MTRHPSTFCAATSRLPAKALALKAPQVNRRDPHALAVHVPSKSLRFKGRGAYSHKVASDCQVAAAERQRDVRSVRAEPAIEGLGQQPRTLTAIRVACDGRFAEIDINPHLRLRPPLGVRGLCSGDDSVVAIPPCNRLPRGGATGFPTGGNGPPRLPWGNRLPPG